jgi:threonine/homoserine/homoserine lactone efflux protein
VLAFLPTFVADAAEEGKHVITGMLIVGLIFIGVIALGMLGEHLSERRHRARQRRRAY